MNGWGPKSSVRPSKPGKSTFFGGISRDFAAISRRCLKSSRKKFVFNFRPLQEPPPPPDEEFYGHGGLPAGRTKNQVPMKLAQPFPAQNRGRKNDRH